VVVCRVWKNFNRAIIAAVNPSVAAIVKNKFFIFLFVLFFIN
jgi:hypothetical protein